MPKHNKVIFSVHTSRTMMFAELGKVMDYSMANGNFMESLQQNITGKKSSSGAEKTAGFLKTLYGFDINYPPFKAFRYFWNNSETNIKPILTFIYAVNHDYLLAESIEVVNNTRTGNKVSIESFEENLEKFHPIKYSPNTRKSIAQNIASTWKQAGFIEGKVKNIRKQPEINYVVACFAFLLAWMKGESGDFTWENCGVKALCLGETRLRELAAECARKDLLQYQFAGGVTAFSFENLLKKLEIHAI
jgi:hypothetical protein